MVDKDLFLHDLSVVAILKNEGPYLKEWLDYHLLAGVDHFYLYDNESPDNQAEVAAPYVKAGLVDYFFTPGKAAQMFTHYNSVKRFKFFSRYIAIIDGDEFIYPRLTGGGRLSTSLTRSYRKIPARLAWLSTGKFLVQTAKKRRITREASWRDLRGGERK